MAKKSVMVGMSGGVDSSVAAAVLLQKGYEVIGVTMQIWPDMDEEVQKSEGGCCSLSAVDDARRVADRLGIPYYVMNFKDVFQRRVVDYFKEEYIKGRTPNPCIACNRHVKFDAMLKKAGAMGIDYISTGHYAKIEYCEKRGRFLLKKSVTDKKDQTYALYNLTQAQLARTLMPIGDYTKDRIREIAAEIGLAVASKPDSQEICFVEDNDYASFISKNTQHRIVPGNFVDVSGNVLGKHRGIVHYTIGQRKGLGIAFGKPMFVAEIDAASNTVVLGDESEVFSTGLIAEDMNFISIDGLTDEMRVKAKVRYSASELWASIYPMEGGRVRVVFDEPVRAITPGQSVVFYEDDIVVGGGTILSRAH
ncbi:tRNA (5-methylaminomethyl-2-thiouridylate)-methyltransferase [Anaerobacterium chartisolvens]|uniref:tRNA-specific 2-thiouridylase MnmA n=1 Tax=Anaerobacterium chartisolvens TaxID=1297424 RepID=A0A369B8C9_9FIRM|nr:tRNA 2-thiouridine(34) synthase MnmA [Anaerobacterium chartisolvens]RCX16848.1 tRNA (5-methylaminomethyl-2-thiouridylate)-methyltransferase [Anaerobacterium chartisolvens]